jgi:hypothetical protein
MRAPPWPTIPEAVQYDNLEDAFAKVIPLSISIVSPAERGLQCLPEFFL